MWVEGKWTVPFPCCFCNLFSKEVVLFFFSVKSLSRSHLSKYKNYINYTIT